MHSEHDSDPVSDTQRIVRDDPRRALARLQERVAAGKAGYRTWHNLAVAKANLDDLDGAIEAVCTSLQTKPDSAATHFLHAKLLQEADRHGEALDAYERVAELQPDHPRLATNRGVVRFFLDDLDGAIEDLRRALEEDPADGASLFNLAVVHVVKKDFGHAQRCLEQLIALEPHHASSYYPFLVELGRTQVIEETLTQTHRIKNFMGIVGDRLRRFCDRELEQLDSEGQEDLGAIRDDYERIYGDLVVFLRAIQPRTMRMNPVDFRRLIDRVVFVAINKGEGVAVEREYAEDLPMVRCDLDMLQEAFLNLLLNAIDAVESADRETGCVRIQVQRRGAGVEVAFVDDGVGIAAGDLNRIFQFGFTTKSLGTGIGLSFTRKVIEQHGGTVTAESEAGEGTTIRCFLPASPVVSKNLSNRALRVQLFKEPRELILEEEGGDLGI